ncbi:hypothetical protein J6590_030015 [Homalodisca vitripennis]|nr:hypothetical protein J6590_030015 [Homalodisca vitripennis]
MNGHLAPEKEKADSTSYLSNSKGGDLDPLNSLSGYVLELWEVVSTDTILETGTS